LRVRMSYMTLCSVCCKNISEKIMDIGAPMDRPSGCI
jgi:hypothetical protein